MAKKMNPLLLNVIITLATLIVRLLGITWRYKLINNPPEGRVIYASWHRNLLPLFLLHKNQGIAVLVSQSQDGELIAAPSRKLGYNVVRGSSNKGGGKAIREMVRYSKEVNLGLTPDGPKGPVKEIKEGLVFLAKVTGLPVVLVSVDVNKEKIFNSWDKFRLPLPGAKIKVLYGEKIYIDKKKDTKEAVIELESEMQMLEKQVSQLKSIKNN